ncbi:MAG: pilin [Candidatus Saccharibacteria bacterium]|nr:pilin [Candidatus Saccharibacteria bacterium]
MKTLIKKILVFLAIVAATFITVNLTSPDATFAAARTETFLGMPAWDYGIDLDNLGDTDKLREYIVMIAANVLTAITVASAYLVLGYTIYGGYLYIFSNGDAGKVAGGKKTLTRAFIGLAVVGSTYIILNAIRIAFMGASGSFGACTVDAACVSATDFVTNIINWFIGIAGIVSAIFLVIGGIGYVTSSGDAGKLQKAKSTITYSLIGLAIVGLSLIITAFVSNMVNDATAYNNETLIAKEYHEN